jgi:hypothetical protein
VQRHLLRLSAASALSFVVLSSASAAPVTAADFSGKKICWDNGSTSIYGPGGKYSNTISGQGTWAAAAGGIHVHTDRYDYVAAIQKLPGGTFEAVVSGMKTTGKYCN